MKTSLDRHQNFVPDAQSVPPSVRAITSLRQPESPETAAGITPSVNLIRLWDLPLRVFHWSLVALVTVVLITGEIGGEWMGIHGKAGIAIAGLVTFRLIWGVIGSTHSRFITFMPSPSKIRAYLKGRWRGVGHNPIGAFSVLALLTLLGIQAGTGLFANDDIDFTGPLANLVSSELSGNLTNFHRLCANFILGLVALHGIAIGFYLLVKKDNLIKPMITGWKTHTSVSTDKPIADTNGGGWIAFLIAFGGAAVLVYFVSGAALQTAPVAASVTASVATSVTESAAEPVATSMTTSVAPTATPSAHTPAATEAGSPGSPGSSASPITHPAPQPGKTAPSW